MAEPTSCGLMRRHLHMQTSPGLVIVDVDSAHTMCADKQYKLPVRRLVSDIPCTTRACCPLLTRRRSTPAVACPRLPKNNSQAPVHKL